MNLVDRTPIFIGCKMDGPIRRRLESIVGPERKYFSDIDSTFLSICRLGEDQYVGKVIYERLTTDRIDDVRRNVLSILQRLCPEIRLPVHLEVLACETAQAVSAPGSKPLQA